MPAIAAIDLWLMALCGAMGGQSVIEPTKITCVTSTIFGQTLIYGGAPGLVITSTPGLSRMGSAKP